MTPFWRENSQWRMGWLSKRPWEYLQKVNRKCKCAAQFSTKLAHTIFKSKFAMWRAGKMYLFKGMLANANKGIHHHLFTFAVPSTYPQYRQTNVFVRYLFAVCIHRRLYTVLCIRQIPLLGECPAMGRVRTLTPDIWH